MALALYRRYRPASFAEVVGQEHITEPLCTALAAGRINHAYLFSGPRGCGKTSSARILARSLNCVEGPTPTPCGRCDSCVALAPQGPGSIDVLELDAASHNGVDDARELRDRAVYAPVSSRYRVFIVDEAHMVTTQGFNALLKIVEEPPEHLVFVFATTEPDKVLSTIRSRTHHYPFRLLPPGTLRGLLERVCAEEGVAVEPPVFPLVVRASGGSARDALSVLDQLVAGAGPEGITYARAVPLLGVTDVTLIDDVTDALAAADRAAVFTAVDALVEGGHDPRRFAADLLQRLRDLVLLQAVPDAAERGLVDAPGDELARMAEQADRLGPATLTRYAEIVHDGLTEMRGATAPRLLLELLCARMLLPAASTSDGALLERLERLERRMTIAPPPVTTEPVTTEPVTTEPVTTEPVPVAAPSPVGPVAASGAIDATAVRRLWPEVLRAVRDGGGRTTEVMLNGASVQSVDDAEVVLVHDSAPLARRLSEPRNAEVIATALQTVIGVSWQVRWVHSGDAPPAGAPARPAPPAVPAGASPTRPSRRSAPGAAAPGPSVSAQPPHEPPDAAPAGSADEPQPDDSPLDCPPADSLSDDSPPDDSAPDDSPPADSLSDDSAPDDSSPGDSPFDDEETMLAEAAASGAPADRRDPEEAAMELLTQQLGARRLDSG